jgi:hypothetical protein
MPDEKPEEEIEPWITVQLVPPAPGGYFAAFIVGGPAPADLKVSTRPLAWFALQHLAWTEEGEELMEARVVPVVLEPSGEAIYLDAGKSGGPDHGFAGIAQSAAEAERIGAAVLAELVKAQAAK